MGGRFGLNFIARGELNLRSRHLIVWQSAASGEPWPSTMQRWTRKFDREARENTSFSAKKSRGKLLHARRKKRKERNGFNRFQRVPCDVIFLSPRSLNYEIIIARAISKSKDMRECIWCIWYETIVRIVGSDRGIGRIDTSRVIWSDN